MSPSLHLPETLMTDEPFQVGQRVELIGDNWMGLEGVVWEIGDEYLGVIYDHEARAPEVTPHYLALADASSQIRVLRPKQRPPQPTPRERFPSGSEIVFRTIDNNPYGGFDSRDIVASLGRKGTTLDVDCTRMTGILPARWHEGLDPNSSWDGTWAFSRRLTPDEWRQLEAEFARFDFWSLPYDDAVRADPLEEYEYWTLLIDWRGKQHEVDRMYRPNEIEPLCRLLYDLAKQPGLTRGDSSALI